MADLTYYQRKRDVILNRAKDCYENEKGRLREQAKDKYRNLSEEEKNKKREYGKNRYCNMYEEKKKRLKEYQRNFCEARKSQYDNEKKKKFFNYDLIKHAIYLAVLIQFLYSFCFRQTHGNKKPSNT